MILNIIKQAIAEYNLFKSGSSVLVGLSGGADSVCLTHILHALSKELDITVYTAHVNHGIRGSEALSDELFAKDFSESLGLKCFVKRADIPAIAEAEGISEETAGRKIRYGFFDEICGKYNIDYIATAHNKNDNAETMLMNFMRGSSTNGLCGIPYKRANIIRPLLDVGRDEIEEYCRNHNLEYVTDSTNLSDSYTRNKIRHIMLPLIEKEFNSGFIDTVTANSRLIREDNALLERMSKDFYVKNVHKGIIDSSILKAADIAIQRRVIRFMLSDAYGGINDIPAKYVCDVLKLSNNQSGANINLADGIVVRNDFGRLVVDKVGESEPFLYEAEVGETVEIPQIKKRVTVMEASYRDSDKNTVFLSCAAAQRIIVRSRKRGDKFYPVGMTGSKKVKQYFIDKKIPRHKRGLIPIIEVNGEIASVGERIDRRFCFEDKGIKIKFEDI